MALESQTGISTWARALGKTAVFARMGHFCDINGLDIAFISEKSEDSTTKALDPYFNVSWKKMTQQFFLSERYWPTGAG